MIQGTSSDVGKSILVTALCRIFARRKINVAPFKAQNMALNSFVTGDGFELSRSQAVQAQAAGIEPDVNMNPILLKPEGDSKSQVVLMGKPWRTISAGSYYGHKNHLWDHVVSSLETLKQTYDLVLIEGAGSPAEINLKSGEIVNMKVARHLSSPVLIVADIDRGGVFAFLYGTLMLLEPEEQELVRGFLINKFRGDIKLLEPGLDMLANLTGGRPTLGVIPYIRDLRIAQEDSVFLDRHRSIGATGANPEIDIVVIRFPRLANYDDFDALAMEEGVRIRFVENIAELGKPSAVILPGTKTTISDLRWLRSQGFARRILELAASGAAIVGICGGYQMLGRTVNDHGVESHGPEEQGLNLLAVETDFEPWKTTRLVKGQIRGGAGFLNTAGSGTVEGYEIHMGRTRLLNGGRPLLRIDGAKDDGAISADGAIWGTYLHGIFDTPLFRHAWLRSLGWRGRALPKSMRELREEEFEKLADHVEQNLNMDRLLEIIGL